MEVQAPATNPKELIISEFLRRRERNAAYSLRAFAQALSLPSGRLSEILSGKRSITARLAEQLAHRLALDPGARKRFLASVPPSRRKPTRTPTTESPLGDDVFRAISDWYHFAILSLTQTPDFCLSFRWIAGRLGISSIQARAAWERLVRLGLVTEKAGIWKQADSGLSTGGDGPSSAVRLFHAQLLAKAVEGLEQIPTAERDVSAVTMAVPRKNVVRARRLIKDFQNRFCRLMETGHRSDVYALGIQFFPLTKASKKELPHVEKNNH